MKESNTEQSVRERLLESARNEFSEQGYEKASLRRISAGAGVTTGAVYFFFKNKEELFEQVIGETLKKMSALSQEMAREELCNPDVGVDNEERLLEFFWKNKQCIMILLDKAQGTKYENFQKELERQMEDTFALFFRKYGQENPDRDLIHILVRMKLQGYRAMMEGDYSLERLRELSRLVGCYTDEGFKGLMAGAGSDHGAVTRDGAMGQ